MEPQMPQHNISFVILTKLPQNSREPEGSTSSELQPAHFFTSTGEGAIRATSVSHQKGCLKANSSSKAILNMSTSAGVDFLNPAFYKFLKICLVLCLKKNPVIFSHVKG